MPAKTVASLIGYAVAAAGWRAPVVLLRYIRLSVLNRTSRGRPIGKVAALRTGEPNGSRVTVNGTGQGDVVVPVYNNFEDTRGLLAALEAEAGKIGSIILVHDCSTDDRLRPLLRDFAARVGTCRLLENEANRGFVETCNRGLAESERDVVILNTDIELPPGALARLFGILASDARIATVTPFSSSAYGVGFPDLNVSNPRPFGATTVEIDRAFQSLPALAPLDVPRGVGFCLAMSRRALRELGPFRLDYGQGYGEETDFCLRAAAAGYRNVIAPNTYVLHKGGESFGGAWQAKARAGQMMILDRFPAYVSQVAGYLAASEARSVGFAALVALAAARSGQSPSVRRRTPEGGVAPALPSDAAGPTVDVLERDGRIEAEVTWGAETYPFIFADAGIARAAFSLAGLDLG